MTSGNRIWDLISCFDSGRTGSSDDPYLLVRLKIRDFHRKHGVVRVEKLAENQHVSVGKEAPKLPVIWDGMKRRGELLLHFVSACPTRLHCPDPPRMTVLFGCINDIRQLVVWEKRPQNSRLSRVEHQNRPLQTDPPTHIAQILKIRERSSERKILPLNQRTPPLP